MKLSAIHVQNFRSVKDASIKDIDNFNVLIGKNNAGKSSVLSAIHAFFQILANGSLVSSRPAIGELTDFTQKNPNDPIAISARFLPSRLETVAMLQRIREERPQIGTALEALPHELYLSVRLSILPPPQRYSFVESIMLSSFSDPSREWLLLKVDFASAEELHRNYRDDEVAQRTSEGFTRTLSRIDDDDWKRLRQPDTESYLLRAMLDSRFSPTMAAPPETMAIVRRVLEASQSFTEFQTGLRERIATLEEERRTIAERRLGTRVKTFAGDEDQIPGYAKALIRSIVEKKVLFLQERRQPIGGEEAQKILNLKTRRGGSETLSRIQNIVTQLLGVHLDAFSSDKQQTRADRSSAEIDVDDFLVELNGSGIREAIRLILDTTFVDPDILLVEEPEIHLHPGLETAMMRFLKEISEKCQVFITTHSTNFLDSGNYQRIYLVTRDKTTLVEALALQEAEERIPAELGIRLSSLFMYDRLVFVEGPSDELIIREFCNALSVNLSRGNVGFVALRGIGNLSYYAANETLNFLQKRNVEITFLIDRDERADSEIKHIEEALGPKVVFFPTEARELENYLMIPSVLAQYIAERKDDGTKIDSKDIEALLSSKADELKGYTLLKHLRHGLRPIYPGRRMPDRLPTTDECVEHFRQTVAAMRESAEILQKDVDAVYEQTIAKITSRWDNEKYRLVAGTELLDEVFKTYRLRFIKLRDGPGLAAKLSEKDIDRDLSAILRRLDS